MGITLRASRPLAIVFSLIGCSAVAGGEFIPGDPDFGRQWGMRNTGQDVDGQTGLPGADIDAPGAWSIHRGGSRVVVAIVGRGIDPHPEFADRILDGAAFVGDPFNTHDTCPHDTHLAGIIGAGQNNGIGIAGLNPRAWLLPVRVLDGCGGTERDTAEGIRWAVDHDADIILAAVQFFTGTKELEQAVQYAAGNDVLVIAPTGNTSDSSVAYPAGFAGCMAVAGATPRDEIAAESNYGPEVDLAGPGEGIWSTWVAGGYDYQPEGRAPASASAFVAGVAALLRSYNPQLSAADVAQVLIDSADDLGDPGWDPHFGYGRLDARRALAMTPAPALRIEQIERFPTMLPPGMGSSFLVRIAEGTEGLAPGGATLTWWLDGSDATVVPLTSVGNGVFRVELPPVLCDGKLLFHLRAEGDGGSIVTDPRAVPGRLHLAGSGYEQVLFADDFEADKGWAATAEGDDDTLGHWERVEPVGTSAQPGYDHTPGPGGMCYLTGQYRGGSDGHTDVDGGPVILTSPVIPLPDADVVVEYARWFYWNGAETEDFLTVEASADGGSTWTVVETVSSAGSWETHRFRLSDFPQLSGNQLRLRFSTSDVPNDSLTEAAIDDVVVRAIHCSALAGDADFDGTVGPADVAAVPACLLGPGSSIANLGSSCMALDVDHDFRTDLKDYAAFQRAFGGP